MLKIEPCGDEVLLSFEGKQSEILTDFILAFQHFLSSIGNVDERREVHSVFLEVLSSDEFCREIDLFAEKGVNS